MEGRKYILIGIILLIIPLVSAQYYGYYDSPLAIFDNEWAMFGIIFIIFFGIIFYTINRSFKNVAVSASVAGALSLLIALTMARRGLLLDYTGYEMGSWVMIIVFLIGLAFIARFAYENFGPIGTGFALMGIWAILRAIDIYEFLPYELLTDNFIKIYGFITSFFGLAIIIIAIIIIVSMNKDRTVGGQFAKLFGKRTR